jgi:pimeloyl-ACP methyl ester carboxylesterase
MPRKSKFSRPIVLTDQTDGDETGKFAMVDELGLCSGGSPSSTKSSQASTFPVQSSDLLLEGHSFHVLEQGHGPAVLFCHGFPDTAQTWRRQMSAIAEAGYRAISLDMRGFGRSYAPSDPKFYSALHHAGDLVGVLDALAIDQAVLVGHDWGADHAQRAAVMRPDRFRGLVSISIPFAPRGARSHWDALRARGLGERYYAFDMMKRGAERLFEPAAETIPGILYWLSASPPTGTGWDPVDPDRSMLRSSPVAVPDWADPEYVAHTIRSFESGGFRGGLNHYRAAQETFDLMAAFKSVVIRQPSLYIWGAEDGLCNLLHSTPPTVADMKDAQPALLDVIRLENVGHWVQHEAVDRLNVELIKFLHAIGTR